MARFHLLTDHTVFIQWLLVYLLLHPYLQLAAAISLPSPHAGNDVPPTADNKDASPKCDPNAQDYESQMLCEPLDGNTTAVPQGVHVDTPAPGTYHSTHPFFVWQQDNFLASDALQYYANWSIGAHKRRLTALGGDGPPVDETRLFDIELLEWMDFDCGGDQQRCGCPLDSNVLNAIIKQIPYDAIKARRVYFVKKMITWANELVCEVLNSAHDAELALIAKSGEFAEMFFLKPDEDAKAECDKQSAVASALVGGGIAVGLSLFMEVLGPLAVAAQGVGSGIVGSAGLVKAIASNAVVPAEQTAFAASRNIAGVIPSIFRTNTQVANPTQLERATKMAMSKIKEIYSSTSPKTVWAESWDKALYNMGNIAALGHYKAGFDHGGRCGLALPKDESVPNTATAMTDVSSYMKMMTTLLHIRMGMVNEGLAPPDGDPPDIPSEMAIHLKKLFGRFIPEETILKATGNNPETANTIEQFITERLVEKAWRTKPCYIHCGPNYGYDMNICSSSAIPPLQSLSFCPSPDVVCQAACWRGGPDMTNDPLYGYNDPRFGNPNWQINLTDVLHGSYWDWNKNQSAYNDDYRFRSMISSIDELADAGGIRLPVCYSQYAQIHDYTELDGHLRHTNGQAFPCSCGNDWADDSLAFYGTDDRWSYLESRHGFHGLGEYVEMCLGQLQKPMKRKVAKFAVSMCYATIRTYPMNHEGVQGFHESGRNEEGRQVCTQIIDKVQIMRGNGNSEAEIDGWVCGVVNVNRGETQEKHDQAGFQRVLHEIQDKCD